MPFNTYLKNLMLSTCVLFVFQNTVIAQIVIGAPNLGFSQACASESFNSYNATFVFSPDSAISGSNQFSIEMSDAEGDFTDAVVVATSTPGEFMTSPATMSFSLPTNTAGEGYKIRVKSTGPVATSSRSVAFAAYYKIQDSPFSINNLVASGAYCDGGSYLLTIDNPGVNGNDSPLKYENLTFNWYRETGPTTSVFVAEGNSLEVTAEGTYFAETNYGTCTSNSFSNRVNVSEVSSSSADAGINSSLGNPYCPDLGMTTLTTISGSAYQWFKDGDIIEGANDQFYETDESGTFSVQVDLGECQTSGTIELVSEALTASIDVSEVNEIEEGGSLSVFVDTDALDPTFEWYLNNELIVEATDASFTATQIGLYEVIVSENSGCEVSQALQFEIVEAIDMFPDVSNIPNIISPNGDNVNDTWMIPTQYVNGTNTRVTIFSSRGEMVLQTENYQNDWPTEALELTSINQVFYYIISPQNGDEKKGSITVIK